MNARREGEGRDLICSFKMIMESFVGELDGRGSGRKLGK